MDQSPRVGNKTAWPNGLGAHKDFGESVVGWPVPQVSRVSRLKLVRRARVVNIIYISTFLHYFIYFIVFSKYYFLVLFTILSYCILRSFVSVCSTKR